LSAQNNQIGAPQPLITNKPPAEQNGGSARGYQELPAPLAIPPRASRQRPGPYFYALPALDVNFRLCRDEVCVADHQMTADEARRECARGLRLPAAHGFPVVIMFSPARWR